QELRDGNVGLVPAPEAHAFSDVNLALDFLGSFPELRHGQNIGLDRRRQHRIEVPGGGVFVRIEERPDPIIRSAREAQSQSCEPSGKIQRTCGLSISLVFGLYSPASQVRLSRKLAKPEVGTAPFFGRWTRRFQMRSACSEALGTHNSFIANRQTLA